MNSQLLIHCLICGFIFSACFIHEQVFAQACRDVNPSEQQLYKKMIDAWDQAVLLATRQGGWEGQLKNEKVTPSVSRGRPLPERPMMFCSKQRFVVDCQLPDNSPKKKMIYDSTQFYLNQMSQSPTKEALQILQQRISYLNGQLSMQISAGINIPLFILSSPHSGPIPSSCHKINIPGVALAYELTWHNPQEADHYKIVLGLGKWKDDVRNYDLHSELNVHYHFSHPYPAAVIENVIVTINAGSLEEARRLAEKIDWKTLNAVLE